MKITIDLPEYDANTHPGHEPDGSPSTHGDCGHCSEELGGTAVRLHPLGWIHATCVIDAITTAPVAWVAVARHVAKSPMKQGTATVRAVITQLVKLVEAGAR